MTSSFAPYVIINTACQKKTSTHHDGNITGSQQISSHNDKTTPHNDKTCTFGGAGMVLSGERARLPPMLPEYHSQTWRHMWVEFVGSLLYTKRFFTRYSGFPLSSKTKI